MSVKVYSWQDAAKVLEKGINRNKVIPGNGISAEATPHGTVISTLRDGSSDGGGPIYSGYFTVMDFSDDDGFKVRVINGQDIEDENAGFYTHGRERHAVQASDVIVIPGERYIYINITFNGSNYVFEYWSFDSPRESDSFNLYRPIAIVKYKDGALNIQQLQYGDLLTPGVL